MNDKEVVDVKSTGVGLNDHDVEQIQAFLDATNGKQATLRMPGGTKGGLAAKRKVDRVRIVFTDVRGARGSWLHLSDWLRKFEQLTVEVFVDGAPRVFSSDDLSGLQALLGATHAR